MTDDLSRSGTAPSGRIKALDKLLDLPHLDILLRYVLTHTGRRRMLFLEGPGIHSRQGQSWKIK